MAQPLTQARVCFLASVGEDEIIELVAGGLFLDEVIQRIDPQDKTGIRRPLLSRWLTGHLRRNVNLADGTPPETKEQAEARAKKYEDARKQWAESIVETQAKALFDEKNDKMANLRKAQSEFALKLAGIHNHKYVPPPSSVTAVQVNVNNGKAHLNALRRRLVKPRPKASESLSSGESVSSLALPATLRPAANVIDAEIVQESAE